MDGSEEQAVEGMVLANKNWFVQLKKPVAKDELTKLLKVRIPHLYSTNA
jgi:hypothetical protein